MENNRIKQFPSSHPSRPVWKLFRLNFPSEKWIRDEKKKKKTLFSFAVEARIEINDHETPSVRTNPR